MNNVEEIRLELYYYIVYLDTVVSENNDFNDIDLCNRQLEKLKEKISDFREKLYVEDKKDNETTWIL